MDKILIPDCCQELTNGSIVIIGRFPETKWVLHQGWYVYEGAKYNGWYFVSIPAQTVLPVIGSDLQNITIVSMGERCNDTPHICPCPPSPTPSIRSIEQYMAGIDYTKGQILWLEPGVIFQVAEDFKSSYTWESIEDNLKDDIESRFLVPITSEALSGSIMFALDFQSVFGTDTPTKTEADAFLAQFNPPISPMSGIVFVNTNQESKSTSSMYAYVTDSTMSELVFIEVTSKGIKGDKGDAGTDGKSLEFDWQATQLGIRQVGESEYQYQDLKGEKGQKGDIGENGKSAYQVWLDLGNKGDESTFIASLKGEKGETGRQGEKGEPGEQGQPGETGATGEVGADGKSLEFNWNGTQLGVRQEGSSEYQYTDLKGASGDTGATGEQGQIGLKGDDGKSAYQVWLDAGNHGDVSDFLDSLKGEHGERGTDGENGKSAYQVWLDQGNQGDESVFLTSLKGEKGDTGAGGQKGDKGDEGQKGDTGADGKSAFQVWKDQGNEGDENDFLESLKGEKGEPGVDGAKGEKGDTGAKGQRGDKGDTGETGKSLEFTWDSTRLGVRQEGTSDYQYTELKGETGATGEPGTKGEQGEQGKTGADGRSAYQVWIDAGNIGDETTFLASLKGEKGETGTPGSNGEKGEPGQNGTDGKSLEFAWSGTQLGIRQSGDSQYQYQELRGVDGEKGDTGADGKSAYEVWRDQGHTGDESEFLESLKGEQGETGERGQQGDKGDDGFSPTVSIESLDNGIKIILTDKNGEYEATVLNGAVGPQGTNGYQISLRVQNGEIQWNWVGADGSEAGVWTALVPLSEITGPTGEDGNDGSEITGITFTSSNKGEEPGIAGATDTYTVSCSNGNDYTFSVYNGRNGLDGGIVVDEEMSNSSTNTVQNKVVKKYVDDYIGDIAFVLATLVEVTD